MTVYPGFREFCEEILAIPQVKMDTKVAQYKQRITFLTARPQFLRKRSKKDLQASGFTHFTRKLI
jgi:hypothetical protein